MAARSAAVRLCTARTWAGVRSGRLPTSGVARATLPVGVRSWATPSAPPKSWPSPLDGATGQRADVVGSDVEVAVHRAAQRAPDPLVHERAEREQHDRHHAGEHDREADPDREPAQHPPSDAQAVADASNGLDRVACRTAGRSCRAGTRRTRRRRSSGCRSRDPRPAPAAGSATAPVPALRISASSSANSFERERDLRAVARATRASRGRATAVPTSSTLGRSAGRRRRERAQAGEQLVERERLREVVVGADVEARHAIGDRVACRQHQHGRPDAVGAQPATRLEAVDLGQHDVEHDRVVVVRLAHPERVLAARRDVGRMALLGESATQECRDLRLVLDHENAHRAPLSRWSHVRTIKARWPRVRLMALQSGAQHSASHEERRRGSARRRWLRRDTADHRVGRRARRCRDAAHRRGRRQREPCPKAARPPQLRASPRGRPAGVPSALRHLHRVARKRATTPVHHHASAARADARQAGAGAGTGACTCPAPLPHPSSSRAARDSATFAALGTTALVATADAASLPAARRAVAARDRRDRRGLQPVPHRLRALARQPVAGPVGRGSASVLCEALAARSMRRPRRPAGSSIPPSVARFSRSATRPTSGRVRPIPSWPSTPRRPGAGARSSSTPSGRRVRIPLTGSLDLGATAKALAADRAAAAAASEAGRRAGQPRRRHQRRRAAAARGLERSRHRDHRSPADADGQTVAIAGGGLATSSTTVRAWRRGGRAVHHIVDPATGAPATSRLAHRQRRGGDLRRRQRGVDRLHRAGRVCRGVARATLAPGPARSPVGRRRRQRAAGRPTSRGGRRRDRRGRDDKELWYLARGTGVVSLILLTASLVLGITRATGSAHDAFRVSPPRCCTATCRCWCRVPRGAHRDIGARPVRRHRLDRRRGPALGVVPAGLARTRRRRLRPADRRWPSRASCVSGSVCEPGEPSTGSPTLCWPVALVHGLGTGSDVRASWLHWLVAGVHAAVVAAAWWRLAATPGLAARWRWTAACGVLLAPILLTLWLESGPLAAWLGRAGRDARAAAAPGDRPMTLDRLEHRRGRRSIAVDPPPPDLPAAPRRLVRGATAGHARRSPRSLRPTAAANAASS